MIKTYNFIIDGKIIEVHATSKTEAESKANHIYEELKTEQFQQQQ
ncbi:hypothetical protein [Psychrobacillus faecigallinarum]|nr:hypothetical protein [Psychrobacillus faecigallinarum]